MLILIQQEIIPVNMCIDKAFHWFWWMLTKEIFWLRQNWLLFL